MYHLSSKFQTLIAIVLVVSAGISALPLGNLSNQSKLSSAHDNNDSSHDATKKDLSMCMSKKDDYNQLSEEMPLNIKNEDCPDDSNYSFPENESSTKTHDLYISNKTTSPVTSSDRESSMEHNNEDLSLHSDVESQQPDSSDFLGNLISSSLDSSSFKENNMDDSSSFNNNEHDSFSYSSKFNHNRESANNLNHIYKKKISPLDDRKITRPTPVDDSQLSHFSDMSTGTTDNLMTGSDSTSDLISSSSPSPIAIEDLSCKETGDNTNLSFVDQQPCAYDFSCENGKLIIDQIPCEDDKITSNKLLCENDKPTSDKVPCEDNEETFDELPPFEDDNATPDELPCKDDNTIPDELPSKDDKETPEKHSCKDEEAKTGLPCEDDKINAEMPPCEDEEAKVDLPSKDDKEILEMPPCKDDKEALEMSPCKDEKADADLLSKDDKEALEKSPCKDDEAKADLPCEDDQMNVEKSPYKYDKPTTDELPIESDKPKVEPPSEDDKPTIDELPSESDQVKVEPSSEDDKVKTDDLSPKDEQVKTDDLPSKDDKMNADDLSPKDEQAKTDDLSSKDDKMNADNISSEDGKVKTTETTDEPNSKTSQLSSNGSTSDIRSTSSPESTKYFSDFFIHSNNTTKSSEDPMANNKSSNLTTFTENLIGLENILGSLGPLIGFEDEHLIDIPIYNSKSADEKSNLTSSAVSKTEESSPLVDPSPHVSDNATESQSYDDTEFLKNLQSYKEGSLSMSHTKFYSIPVDEKDPFFPQAPMFSKLVQTVTVEIIPKVKSPKENEKKSLINALNTFLSVTCDEPHPDSTTSSEDSTIKTSSSSTTPIPTPESTSDK